MSGNVVSISQRVKHQNDVVTGRFELELEPRHSRVEKIEEDQSENRNPKTASRCDQCFCDAAADFGRCQIGIPNEIKRAHDSSDRTEKTQEGCQRNGRIHHRHKPPGSLNLYPGGNLQSSFQGSVNVIQSMPDRTDQRIFGTTGKIDRRQRCSLVPKLRKPYPICLDPAEQSEPSTKRGAPE